MPSLWSQLLTPADRGQRSTNKASALMISDSSFILDATQLPMKYHFFEQPEESSVLGCYLLPSSASSLLSIPKKINAVVIVLDWKHPDQIVSSFFAAVARLKEVDHVALDLEAIFSHTQEFELAGVVASEATVSSSTFDSVKLPMEEGTLDRNKDIPLIVVVENVCAACLILVGLYAGFGERIRLSREHV
jgi:hypothetical protein